MTTDIIVGFPGETEEDFQDTMDILRTVRFDQAYTFIYSKRTGTPAAKLDNQIPEEMVKNRFSRLLDLHNQICKERNEEMLGSIESVLVEGLSKNNDAFYTGRTDGNKVVNFKATEHHVGQIVSIRITSVKTWHLEGELLK
jgi:tRNA-2-methylthio-N6-dimethylallyladenosine synthase